LTGGASGTTDTALLDTPNGDISAVGQDSVLHLGQGWNSRLSSTSLATVA
jgi:hypothetical protein